MKISVIKWWIMSAIVMLALPWLAVTFIKGDAGMAICFLLFYAINPVYSLVVGVHAGKHIKEMWGIPIGVPVLFLLGTWIFFDMGETAFIMYAAVYLVLGIGAMVVSKCLKH